MGRRKEKQLALEFPKLDRNGQRRGGARKGAGRPSKSKRPGRRHGRRPTLGRHQAAHVTLRVLDDIGSLRKRKMYAAVRLATLAVALRELHDQVQGAFRIVHVSIQRTHIHLLVEADHIEALSNGMQRFQISAAKHLNRMVSVGRAVRRRGTVFPDRFHLQVITNPTQARHALSYVLNNWRKHGESRDRSWRVDPFSTAALFPGWQERDDEPFLWRWPTTYEPLVVYRPQTWLLSEGWRRAGVISYSQIPSSPAG